jgi:hypothetical protein
MFKNVYSVRRLHSTLSIHIPQKMSQDGISLLSITDHYLIDCAGRMLDKSEFPACYEEVVLGSRLCRQGEKIDRKDCLRFLSNITQINVETRSEEEMIQGVREAFWKP